MQIFRTPVQIGRTDQYSKVNYSNGSDLERLKMQAALEHLRSQERAFWFGYRDERAAIDSSGTRQRSTGGMFQFVTTNQMDISGAGGALTTGVLDAFAEMAFDKGSSEKFLFCSPRVLSRINSLSEHLIRRDSETKMFGSNVSEYVTSHGTFILIRQPLFAGSGFSTTYAGHAFCVDAEQVKYAYLDQAENAYHDNIQENDRDGYKGEWIGECGLHLANETSHSILMGVA